MQCDAADREHKDRACRAVRANHQCDHDQWLYGHSAYGDGGVLPDPIPDRDGIMDNAITRHEPRVRRHRTISKYGLFGTGGAWQC